MQETYSIYKPTTISWLQEIPEHWETRKVKHLFKERSEKGFPDEPLLAATQTKGVVRKEDYETRTVTAQKDFHLLKLVKKEDFVISLRSFQGGIEYARHQGIISPAYSIFYKKKETPVYKGYFRHLFKSYLFINSLSLFVTGIREGQNIDYTAFRNATLPLPPYEEQTAIANYLDAKKEQINRFIEKKERLIALLKEQKQAIINELLEDKEGKWERKKLKFIATIKGRIGFRGYTTSDLVSAGNGALVIGASHINSDGKIDLAEPVYLSWEKYYESPEIMVEKDNLVIVQRGSTCGKVGLINDDYKEMTINPSLVLIKNVKGISEFALYSIQIGVLDILNEISSTAIPMLSQHQIGNIKISFPSIGEQRRLLEQIKIETEFLNATINRIQTEIQKVKELKQSLIAEVVTGKIKVV